MRHSLANQRVTRTPHLGQLLPPPHTRSDLERSQPPFETPTRSFSDFSRLSTGSSKRKYASTEDRANENACGKIYAIVSQPGGTNQTPLLNVVHSKRNQGCTVNSRYEDGCPRVVPWSKPPSGPRHGFPCAPLNCHSNEHSRG